MFKINGREIGEHAPPFVIAELSANHNGSLERAKLSIKAAKDYGAHAIKLQTYTPDTMTIDCDCKDFIISGGLWDGYKLYDLYDEAHTPFEWHKELFDYAAELGITAFSTPFDETAVDLLEGLQAPAFKIASFELLDLPLIRRVAQTGKPILMSTGLASFDEIGEAVEAARSAGARDLLLFHCISSYPAPIEQANLKMIPELRKQFGVPVGLSDHTLGSTAATAAVALGACAIEKHFTLDRREKGPDSEFSMEPHELRDLIKVTHEAWAALGTGEFKRAIAEEKNKIFRRSLYFVESLKAGAKISEKDVRRIRPGYGLAPKHLDEIVGRSVSRDVNRGEPVVWDVLKP